MTRVMIIGNAGGGKSTLARVLSARLGLPCLAIDRIQWCPGWVPAPAAAFDAAHAAWLQQDRWIIDGYGSWPSIEDRLDACDTVIFVDLPFPVHLWWATRRQVASLFRGRPDGPPGCPMWRVTLRLYPMMWRLHRTARPHLLQKLRNHAARVRVVHITSPAALDAFARNPV